MRDWLDAEDGAHRRGQADRAGHETHRFGGLGRLGPGRMDAGILDCQDYRLESNAAFCAGRTERRKAQAFIQVDLLARSLGDDEVMLAGKAVFRRHLDQPGRYLMAAVFGGNRQQAQITDRAVGRQLAFGLARLSE